MNALLLPLLLAVASPELPEELYECGGAPLFADQATFVADDAIASTAPAMSPVPAVEPVPAPSMKGGEAVPEPAAQVDPAAPADETVAIHAGDAADDDRRCLTATGSRIRDDDGRDCRALPGDSYDRDDIDRTGAIDTADAIRKLSPSATIRR
jgi:hypothetical protein